MRVLLAWIGHTDLKAAEDEARIGIGPLAQALRTGWFDRAVLLDDYPTGRSAGYLEWLACQAAVPLDLRAAQLTSPVHFGDIYRAAVAAVAETRERYGQDVALTFHLSPGTPAMAAVWLLLAKARYNAELIESSRDHGVRKVEVPFDIAADFLPDLLRAADARLVQRAGEPASERARFGDIVYRSPEMARLVDRARRAAVRAVPVLLSGESGTGKELLARALHAASPRANKPFVALNCGAIPAELVEAELFGHERGAFTGAAQARPGVFELAHGGTLLLDEIGELPLAAQVKLLRVLQEAELRRVGGTAARKVDVRILAATHRDLLAEVRDGRFREDLFFRLAVAVLHLPALRDRSGDLALLVDHLWVQVQQEAREDPGWQDKDLSIPARNALVAHRWPGNVRELLNTLRRVALWTEGPVVTAEDVREALLTSKGEADDAVLGRPLGDGLSLPSVLTEVARHYLARAMTQANGNKTQAADLVGLASYQTLTNWLDRYGVATELARDVH
ncbi:MAG: sigma-54 interaction domain-containing protein [Myxococcota bacterium]